MSSADSQESLFSSDEDYDSDDDYDYDDDSDNDDYLLTTAEIGDAAGVKMLLDEGADIETKNEVSESIFNDAFL